MPAHNGKQTSPVHNSAGASDRTHALLLLCWRLSQTEPLSGRSSGILQGVKKEDISETGHVKGKSYGQKETDGG